MQKIKENWDIKKNWQILFPFLGILTLLFSGYTIAKIILAKFSDINFVLLGFLTILIAYGLLNFILKIFKRLTHKWQVNNRWELIAIFLVFAVTGSMATKISGPLINIMELKELISNSFLFWTVRVLIIFPIYQLSLVMIGWLFGQFDFFWAFEKKMLKRLGFKRFFNE